MPPVPNEEEIEMLEGGEAKFYFGPLLIPLTCEGILVVAELNKNAGLPPSTIINLLPNRSPIWKKFEKAAHPILVSERTEEQRLSPELQKELYDARNYHVGLHVEYTQLKNTYEKTVKLSDEEWSIVEEHALSETFNKLISTFWENIEFITTAFFDILEILGGKNRWTRRCTWFVS